MNIFKNNQWLSVLTIFLLVVNIVTLTMLWANNKKEFVTKELSLNEQQQQQYKILRDEHQRLQRPLADTKREINTRLLIGLILLPQSLFFYSLFFRPLSTP